MNLELDDRYVFEVFEILCDVPDEEIGEQPYTRNKGIEQLLDQLQKVIDGQTVQEQ